MNVVTRLIIFLLIMTYERSKETKTKKELSGPWHGEGSRRRGCIRKIKGVKAKIIFFCQNHAVVNVVVVVTK